MAGKRRHRERRAARRPESRSPRRRLLVVCEGQRTEPDYIRGFVRHARNVAVEVQVADEQGEPRRVVEIAKDLKERAEAEARRQRDDFLLFDEVWCVFDRDRHDRFHEACDMARSNALELAVSNPCFELWLLLHFRDSPGIQDCSALLKMLRQHLVGYDKRVSFPAVVQGVGDATRRARRLDEEAERLGQPGMNPTTSVYRLTDSIARIDEVNP